MGKDLSVENNKICKTIEPKRRRKDFPEDENFIHFSIRSSYRRIYKMPVIWYVHNNGHRRKYLICTPIKLRNVHVDKLTVLSLSSSMTSDNKIFTNWDK